MALGLVSTEAPRPLVCTPPGRNQLCVMVRSNAHIRPEPSEPELTSDAPGPNIPHRLPQGPFTLDPIHGGSDPQ